MVNLHHQFHMAKEVSQTLLYLIRSGCHLTVAIRRTESFLRERIVHPTPFAVRLKHVSMDRINGLLMVVHR